MYCCGGGCLIAAVLCPILGISPYKPVHFLIGPFCFSAVRLVLRTESFQPCECLSKLLKWNDGFSYEVYLVHQVLILGDFSLALVFPESPCIVIVTSIIGSLTAAVALHWISRLCYRLIDKLKERASNKCD
jgi:peptidoglycan/LPS O-acetylase OafA/YrhL